MCAISISLLITYVGHQHFHWGCADCGHRESHRQASQHLGSLCQVLRGTWAGCRGQSSLEACSIQVFIGMCVVFRLEWFLRRPPKWTSSMWTTWLLCGVNILRWSSDTSMSAASACSAPLEPHSDTAGAAESPASQQLNTQGLGVHS